MSAQQAQLYDLLTERELKHLESIDYTLSSNRYIVSLNVNDLKHVFSAIYNFNSSEPLDLAATAWALQELHKRAAEKKIPIF